MAFDDDIIPLEEHICTTGDHADLEDLHNTERHLICVACTRARDHQCAGIYRDPPARRGVPRGRALLDCPSAGKPNQGPTEDLNLSDIHRSRYAGA